MRNRNCFHERKINETERKKICAHEHTRVLAISHKNITESMEPDHLFKIYSEDSTKGTVAGPFRTDVRVLLCGIIAP